MIKILLSAVMLLSSLIPTYAQTDSLPVVPSVTELTITYTPVPSPQVVNTTIITVNGTVTKIEGQSITLDKGDGSSQILNVPKNIKILKYDNNNATIQDIKINDSLSIKEDNNGSIVSIEDTTKISVSQLIWSIFDLLLVLLLVIFVILYSIKRSKKRK